jgi:hypothetical protein
MNRHKFEQRMTRAIRVLMEGPGGDGCSICKKPFEHRGTTYGGVDASGQPQLVGECCKTKFKLTLGTGIYLHWSRLRGAS